MSSNSGSASGADVDSDGDIDVIGDAWAALPPYAPCYLFINDGYGVFTDETDARLPDTAFLSVATAFADIDADKDYDAYIISEHDQDLLYINDGFGYFSDETSQRLPPLACTNAGFVYGDFSGDGHLDIITICGYASGLNHYLLNNGFGYYEDVTSDRMPLDTLNEGVGVAADLDNDLDLDLLLDWLSGSSNLHIRGLENRGGYFLDFDEGRLADRPTRWINVADIDLDGDLDIIISGITSMGILINESGSFIDESAERLPDFDPDWGGCSMIGLGDYDNDADMDIYTGFGTMIEDHFFVNDGQGYFELADERIPDTRASTRWPEPFDADGDGDLDLYLACTGDGQQRILINHSTPDTIPPVILAKDLPLGDIDTASYYPLRISAYDNISVEKGALSVSVSYKVNGGVFITEPMVHCGGTIFGHSLPGQPPGTEVQYYITVKDKMNNLITSPMNAPDSLHSFTVWLPSGIAEQQALPVGSGLLVYPNPSNAGFRVSYYARESEPITMSIYDLAGRSVHTEELNAPARSAWLNWEWNGDRELPSGVYFVELQTNKRKEAARAVILK